MASARGFWCGLAEALYLDLPYVVDSIWRRAEFNFNRWFSYRVLQESDAPLDAADPKARGELSVRRYAQLHDVITHACQQYTADVKAGTFPAADESY